MKILLFYWRKMWYSVYGIVLKGMIPKGRTSKMYAYLLILEFVSAQQPQTPKRANDTECAWKVVY